MPKPPVFVWPKAGLHGGKPCPGVGPYPLPAHAAAIDDPFPQTLWRGHAPPPKGRIEVRRQPPLNWLDRPKRGWAPFRAQVCPDCGLWREVPFHEPPLRPSTYELLGS